MIFVLLIFVVRYDLPIHETYNCLKVLELQGLIELTDTIALQSRVHIIAHRDQLYEFQVKNPPLDHFIKILLRSYEGLFDDFVYIQESQLARRMETDASEIVKHLDHLHKLNVISYVPSNDIPQLTFLEPRQDVKNLAYRKEKPE